MVVDSNTQKEIDLIFQALSDATRRDIIVRVFKCEQSVSSLAQHYSMSFAAVQKHVAVLERASLVGKVQRGRERIVHGNVDALRKAASLLDNYEEIWRQRVVRIEDILGEEVRATEGKTE